MHAHAAVKPGEEQDYDLAHPECGSRHPQREDHRGIGILHVKPGMRQTRAHHMGGQQEGNRQAHQELHSFPDGHVQASALIEGPQGERAMARQGPIQHCSTQRIAP